MSELWDFLRGALLARALAAVADVGVPRAIVERSAEQWRTLLEGAGFEVESLGNPIVATCR